MTAKGGVGQGLTHAEIFKEDPAVLAQKGNMKKILLLLAPLSFLFFSIANAQSDVYLCTDDKGNKKYHNTAIDPEKCKKVDLPGIMAVPSPSPKKVNAQKADSRAKKDGVRIGMSKVEVIASNWGRPNHVNRTTTVRGTSEQWVYGGNNYLYFDNNVLTSIQN